VAEVEEHILQLTAGLEVLEVAAQPQHTFLLWLVVQVILLQ
jgi:hypothetical protein